MVSLAMLARRCGWTAAALAVVAATRPAAGVDAAGVQKSIDAGVAYLFAHQANGNWETLPAPDPKDQTGYSVTGVQWGGPTAVATLALLASGVDSSDPHIQRAVAFLRTADIKGNYALGLRAQVWGMLPPEPWIKKAMADDLRRLELNLLTGKDAGPARGLYGYAAGRPVSEADHSVSQFAVLGVWSLARAGMEVPGAYWQLVEKAWRSQQLRSGGWTYLLVAAPKPGESKAGDPVPADPTTLSMTAAGVATLSLTQEFTQVAPQCNGNVDDPSIDAGLRYLGEHLTVLYGGREYYTLFGISRVGLATGLKRIGPVDWFKWGADYACANQPADGGWTADAFGQNHDGVPDTAFALLFLARGRAPVMLNKLRYDVTTGTGKGARSAPGTWNQRPRDAANLARWVGTQIESPLNWQVVGLADPAEDLHDAPILYMAGGRAPKLSPADTARLRTYLDDGGLLLGHADCAASDFDKGFKALGTSMYPGYKFRPLEPASPIYTNETFPAAAWKTNRPTVEALTNGTRELMVLLPTGDPARTWQTQSFQPAKRETFGQLMIDLFLYAVDKQGLRRRGETYLVGRNGGAPVAKAIKVARVSYAGNWDPEPGGWRRLANVMHNDGSAELTVDAVDGPIDRSYAVASLTVAAADAKLTDAQRTALRDYVKGGGTLLVDAAGGRSLYRAAAEAELAAIFPDAPHALPVLPASSPVFAGGKASLTSVDYRRYQRPGNGHAPLLRGYEIGGRVAVLYSPEDLSTGLVGEPVDGVAGYAPASATPVAEHALLYAGK